MLLLTQHCLFGCISLDVLCCRYHSLLARSHWISRTWTSVLVPWKWIMSECSSMQVHFLPSGPSSVWWWSWARSSWGESTESASCPPPATGCSKAPSDYPGCICACHLSPAQWGRSGSALTTSQPSFNLHVWDVCGLTSTSSSCLLGLWTRNEKQSSHSGSLVLNRIFTGRQVVIC